MPDVVVHHLEQSRSHRILWLLEELGVAYELKVHRRDPRTIRAPAALRNIHPLGKAPLVVIDGEVFAESGAIIEHCVQALGDGKLRPAAGTPAATQYRYWLHYAEGSLMPPLLVRLIIDKVRTAPLPFFIKPIARGVAAKVDATFTDPELALHTRYLEDHLAEHTFFAGDTLTGADVQMSYPVEALLARSRVDFATPHLEGWMQRMRERPAYQRALELGGPVMLS